MSLSPQASISEAELQQGLRRMVTEAGYANAAGAVTTGVILTAFALQLGASNAQIGLLAALPFLCQLLQAPTIILVERSRARKRIAVLSALLGRSLLMAMALLAFLSGPTGLVLLISLQALYCACSAIGSCAWNAWIRDLAPEDRLGRVFARRTLYATLANLVAGLTAAVVLDQAPEGSFARRLAFFGLYACGCIASLISVAMVARMPEPLMRPSEAHSRLTPLLTAPFRDGNFRRLIGFLASWQFAINLATPFFTIYMVRQLGYSMIFVIAASSVSQVANAMALSLWGRLSDRFTNKSVLGVVAPAYILCIAAMALGSRFDDHATGGVYLLVLHGLMGFAVAGVTLASANIALKLSPKGSAAAYMAASAMVGSLAAGLAPILGGLFADYFAGQRLELLLRWTGPSESVTVSPLVLSQWDFYFPIAALFGLYALHRLALVEEKGAIRQREMVEQVLLETGRLTRNLSSVAGLRAMTGMPGALWRDLRAQTRLKRARDHADERNKDVGPPVAMDR